MGQHFSMQTLLHVVFGRPYIDVFETYDDNFADDKFWGAGKVAKSVRFQEDVKN